MGAHEHEDFRRVTPPLEGQLVRLRAIEETDLPAINQGVWDPAVSQYLLIPFPQPLAGTREYWERVRRSDSDLVLVIEAKDGQMVGVVALHDIQGRARTALLGIWVAEPHWDRGYGTDAVRTICRFGFREMNLQRIDLGVLETNPRGKRAYEKVGFREEARLRRAHFVDGRHVDMLLMGLLAEELVED
jgi:RimJ/RimL family protein N-acetyltransferase